MWNLILQIFCKIFELSKVINYRQPTYLIELPFENQGLHRSIITFQLCSTVVLNLFSTTSPIHK